MDELKIKNKCITERLLNRNGALLICRLIFRLLEFTKEFTRPLNLHDLLQ